MLLAQVFLFPLVASAIASYWTNASIQITLQEVASQMGSTIEQLYVSLNQMEISTGTITHASNFPTQIKSYAYTAQGSLRTSSGPGSSKVLRLNLTIQGLGDSAISQVSFGPNVSWNEASLFNSSSPTASIRIQKNADGTLLFSFG